MAIIFYINDRENKDTVIEVCHLFNIIQNKYLLDNQEDITINDNIPN